jgi:hypothetical protein
MRSFALSGILGGKLGEPTPTKYKSQSEFADHIAELARIHGGRNWRGK